jgi:hypothetical protein
VILAGASGPDVEDPDPLFMQAAWPNWSRLAKLCLRERAVCTRSLCGPPQRPGLVPGALHAGPLLAGCALSCGLTQLGVGWTLGSKVGWTLLPLSSRVGWTLLPLSSKVGWTLLPPSAGISGSLPHSFMYRSVEQRNVVSKFDEGCSHATSCLVS